MKKPGLLIAVSAVLLLSPALPAATVWVEGEASSRHNMQHQHGWFNQVKKELLSAGEWLSNYGPAEGVAEFSVAVPEKGSYALWIRSTPIASKLDYSINGGEWTPVDFTETRGRQNIARDNKPDVRFIAWVKAGPIALEKGDAVVKFRMHGGGDNLGGLDSFVLTTDRFIPQGITKPVSGEAPGPADWFPLLADEDTFSPESVIDMTSLTHAPAGKYGPVVADGGNLRFAEGKEPMRFWGAGANWKADGSTPAQSLRRIKYLRKHGINYVRQHTLYDAVVTAGKIDPAKLAGYDWWFSELKKAGIYSCWSVFYHFPISADDGYPSELFNELPKLKNGFRDTYGLIQMSPELWEMRLKIMIALLDHRNPHTGLRYADDPALATVEFQNEDSIFFWNPLSELAKPDTKNYSLHAKLLRQRFSQWAKRRYADDERLKQAWGKLEGESLSDGELGIMGPWELDAAGIRGRFAGQTKRAGDQILFLTEMQRSLYKKGEEAVRATGFKALTVSTNWLGGSSLVDQANIFADTGSSMIDRHNYAGGGAGGHRITEGPIYADSHLGKPGKYLFSIGFKQVEDKPFSLSEWTMCPPNQWKLEAAPIMAFYGMGLQGWDASCHFEQSGSRQGDGWPGLRSYVTDTPHYMGQFPALAFAVHKGHFKEAPVVAARRTSVEGLYTGSPAWPQNYYNGKTTVAAEGAAPPEAFAAGRVTIGFQGGRSEISLLGKTWNKDAKMITSATGELVWDYGNEVILAKSPKTQAVIGRAAGRSIDLPDVSLKIATGFVSLIFTPLDDLPLRQSKRVLITAMARDKQSGARYSEDGTQLESVGGPPLLLEPVQGSILLKGSKPVIVRALDYQGLPNGKELPVGADGTFRIDGTSAAYYYEVRR